MLRNLRYAAALTAVSLALTPAASFAQAKKAPAAAAQVAGLVPAASPESVGFDRDRPPAGRLHAGASLAGWPA